MSIGSVLGFSILFALWTNDDLFTGFLIRESAVVVVTTFPIHNVIFHIIGRYSKFQANPVDRTHVSPFWWYATWHKLDATCT